MSIDIRDLSDANVNSLTRLLSRRPEYGIAIPSRRWLTRQEEKLKSLPSELLRTSNPLKRLVIKIADSIDPNAIDPRAVLCKTHANLNPFLIRRLFLAVAYEVTVHTDTLRSWKGRKDFPIISALIGRVDAIAALWTQPDLYRECYGTPPFENHMVFVKSGCEACIISALGANARVLADLRSILVDRIERRLPRPDGRPAKEPRLARYVDEWINHLKEERAAKCREMSDNVLTELRATRSQVTQWRSKRKKEGSRSKGARKPNYIELRITGSGHELSSIPGTSRHKRRTRNGIPVAMVDPEGAEEQRRMAMFSMTKEAEGAKSIFRPDSMCDYSQFGPPRMPAYDPTNSINGRQNDTPVSGNYDTYEDYEEDEEDEDEADFARNLEVEESSHSKVTNWYATRLAESRADLSADDTRSVLSAVHPAFQPPKTYSHLSAAPTPLRPKKDHQSSVKHNDNQSAWTDVTVHTIPSAVGFEQDVPPVPRVPSMYNGGYSGHNDIRRSSSVRTPRPRSTVSNRPVSQDFRRYASSSVYSDQPPPSPSPSYDSRLRNSNRNSTPVPARQPTRKYIFNDASEGGSCVSAGQREYLKTRKGIKDFAREDNPFTRENTPRPSASTSTSRVPSLSSSSSRRNTVTDTDPGTDEFGPPTPRPLDEAWRQDWGFPEGGEYGDDDTVMPDDSLTVVAEQRARNGIEEMSPWGQFARKGQR
ncbi:uncharacterized protein F4807DRAFT_367527 [Annulohypoxylon truncatum]|uniref:uncharacterized protein n=1 Tax=Annulohypoxylon truncatum TaxID=327061 RepID=UPI0020087C14|nr:uncharacterized protein F4807DRAFT_367527 [Annulohypoxylon truncatum]KAI1212344.1 hypothetical protein F4807DRAFT_367527 [Annulohypoxylon truncatum]